MHDHPTARETISAILPFSRYLQRLLASEPELLAELEQNLHHPFSRGEMQRFLVNRVEATADEAGLNRALRNLRKRVMLRVAARDLSGMAGLAEVMTTMTELAELAIGFALERHQFWLGNPGRFGLPRGADKKVQELLVVAMGKLGGGELNVSSDVDLIFFYPEEGQTDGVRSISSQDFFVRLGRKLIAALSDITEDGYVFRVDMRLRPYGESGPLAMSFSMLEEYLMAQGREWERYAWIKCRVIAGPPAESATLAEQIARPFVFRKYLDFGAYESMRGLHGQIRKEVHRREMHENIKLGPGGIREIEFIAQVFQLIRGGRDPGLRLRPTLSVLRLLGEKGHLSESTVRELTEAYRFLRKLEHRLQYLDDQQTHVLPENPTDQSLVAISMGCSSYEEFLRQLDRHRHDVGRHFDTIFAPPRESENRDSLAWLWAQREGDAKGEAECRLASMGFVHPEKSLGRLQEFRYGARYRQLSASGKKRIDGLVPVLIEAAGRSGAPDVTLARLLQLLESVSRRAAYLALLREYPLALERVVKLVGASQWAGDYLGRHPILLDELLNPGNGKGVPDWPRLKAGLRQQLADIAHSGGGDVEQQMDVLRHFHHTQIFHLLALDVEGLLPLETLSDHLSALADLVLETVLQLAWAGLRNRHREQPVFAIIGYGKLGGKELGYASDLDIIFLYDDDHPDAPEIYARLSQRINSWLGSYTSAGLLYQTDLRLRPNGSSGLLVSSIQAFDQYQRNQAWVWEHQALTRARFTAGDGSVGAAFEHIRQEVLRQKREPGFLGREVLAMRQKMADAHPNSSGLFDVKHDRGGIIDVEFIVQYLVLLHACDHEALTGNIGNIGLLRLAGKLGLIDGISAVRVLDAYREFRRTQHRLRLSGDSDLSGVASADAASQKFARVDRDCLKDERQAVLQLWNEILGPLPVQIR